jgi:hypothetical protein
MIEYVENTRLEVLSLDTAMLEILRYPQMVEDGGKVALNYVEARGLLRPAEGLKVSPRRVRSRQNRVRKAARSPEKQ